MTCSPPPPIISGSTSTLTLPIDNTANTVPLTTLALSDTYPAAITNATPANASTTCGGTVTAADGGGEEGERVQPGGQVSARGPGCPRPALLPGLPADLGEIAQLLIEPVAGDRLCRGQAGRVPAVLEAGVPEQYRLVPVQQHPHVQVEIEHYVETVPEAALLYDVPAEGQGRENRARRKDI